MAAGWRFPSDWALPEVDSVCASVLMSGDLGGPLASLGRARAQAGSGLEETLGDLAALHAVLDGPPAPGGLIGANPDALPARLVRLIALGWAEASMDELAQVDVSERLTGLATEAYLAARLGEVYRRATRRGRCPSDDHLLIAVSVDLSEVTGWSRLLAMVLVADVLRGVFDGGESVAVLGPSVAVVLTEQEPGIAQRVSSARCMIGDRLSANDQLSSAARPLITSHRLPSTHDDARELLKHIARR
ncbi:hypothetical protein EV193_11026 [Herbihabitans rhizosphaerae]|uniref:GGDEF domain-containing protein n=1 Tax=Herbihabitans rhizosphaerae TaxID=1872711 RepID=A0A4Q7KJ49_9PSEU|nr:GGDEF domain-containing protein [Herbihabitans rhizosphaerae]RZS33876.1 hypothetical protein EV193_11026 [Herbihabitans rhizosphaerae]